MRSRACLTWLAGLASLVLSLQALAAAPRYAVTVVTEGSGSGSVTRDPARQDYARNNIVTLTAEADAGSHFVGWSGALDGDANPGTLRVSGDHTVVAHFERDGSGGGGDLPAPRAALPSSGMLVGYFAQWTIYRRGYLPRHVAASGAVQRLNVVNYAFAAPDENGLCASLDSFADWGKRFDAEESVDGVADTVSQPLKGNFNQLLKLKQLNPDLRVLISLGGWAHSDRFTGVARTDESRGRFVASCIDMFIRGHFADGIVAPGVFDGIDVDWEFPGSCGLTCGDPEADPANFTALMAEFRRQLDELSGPDGPAYLLTIAAPAGHHHYEPIELAAVAQHLDWVNLMAYDFHGVWETRGPTNHAAALYPQCENAGEWGDRAVTAYLGAGVPAGKLLLGMPFFGRGWRGVPSVNDGLCQPAGGVPRGTWEKGVDDFEVLAARGDPDYWDESTGTHWTFDGSEFWTFDDPVTAGWKADYANCRELRGIMFWELSGDDAGGTMFDALASRLRSDDSGCRAAWTSSP